MIVLDTTVLVYAVGSEHALREPAQSLIRWIESGSVRSTTTVEAIQEFVHVRARRRGRKDATSLGRAYAALLSPLLSPSEENLLEGLRLYERHEQLGAFDAVLAAAAIGEGAEAFVSAESGFAKVRALPFVALDSPDLSHLAGD